MRKSTGNSLVSNFDKMPAVSVSELISLKSSDNTKPTFKNIHEANPGLKF